MVTKSFTCPNGHRWRATDDSRHCPICGAKAAETLGNGNPELGPTETGQTGLNGPAPSTGKHSRFGRYKVIKELGRGGMGVVYRAFDPAHGRQVALKTLPSTDPILLSRFKHEFRVLADLDHPNVVKLFELNSDGETWFFTMEMIQGVDLLNYVKYGFTQPLDISQHDAIEKDAALTQDFTPSRLSAAKDRRLRDGFAQLAGAITALHVRGIVHRDVKPSNVIVTSDERVVLLDFGLAAETDPFGVYESLHQQVMGTVAYMSPEQAACDPVSPASDWYSVGVMLYQALTDSLPFTGKALDILTNKQQQDPVPPCEMDPSVSQDWNDLCVDLLSRNPQARPIAQECLRRLGGRGHQSAAPSASLNDEVALVGRESQLQSLHETWRAVQSGQAKNVFIEGGSGTGKSSLVEAFVAQAIRDGAVVLTGRCYEMESVPFKAIDSLVDSLVSHLGHLARSNAAALMPRDIHALTRLFPVIGQVEVVASIPRRQVETSDQQELNRRAIGALRELLARMGDRFPLVVYIDDLQWGDEDSAAMLSTLLQPPDPPLLLFLGTYRSEDAGSSQFLQSFRQLQRQQEFPLEAIHIEVKSLEHSDAVKLALSLLRRDDGHARSIAESIAREAAGNPFFVSELVKHIQLEGDQASDSTEPLALVDMIWSRVQRLSEEAQRLLAVVALWGQPMPLEHAMHIAGVGQSAVGPLRAGHFIRTVGLASSSKIETYHDRVRESVSQRLDDATRQRHHLRIAEVYARRSPPNADAIMVRLDEYFADRSQELDDHLEVSPTWYDVAFHFDAAGRSDLAFPYASATAEEARTRFSLEVAGQQYVIAQRGVPESDAATRYRIAEGLGDVLMLRGRYGEPTKKMFEEASRLATDNFTRAQIQGKLGELAFKKGDNKAGIEAVERSLRLLRRTVPSRTPAFLLFFVWEVFVQTLHTMFPKLFLARRSLQGAENELLASVLHVHLARAYFFERGKVPCLWTHLRSVNLAERYPPTRELRLAWASHAPVMSIIPWIRRGEAYGKKAVEIGKTLGDVGGLGQAHNYWGVVLFVGAKYDECICTCREAVRLLERTGDFWERNNAWYSTANALYRKGDLQRAISEAQRLYEVCTEMEDDKHSGWSLEIWSRASGGQLPADIVQREMQKERNDVQATAQVFLAEAVRLVGQDELDEAVRVLTQAREVCRKASMMNAWVSPVLPWLATTFRLQWERSTEFAPDRDQKLLHSAHRAARRAVKVARKFKTDLPHALREAGLVAAMRGSIRKARRLLDESLAVAQRQGAKFEHAQTLLARGSAGQTLNWPGAEEDAAAGRQALTALGADIALAQFTVRE